MLAAWVMLSCVAAACSSGLGGLRSGPADAGGKDSGGGSSGTGGSDAGAGTGGVGGAAGSGAAAGTDAGTDAGDAGTFKCSPGGGVFSVLGSTDLGGASLGSDPPLVVESVPTGTGSHTTMYVVVAGMQNGVPTLFVRALTDNPANHQGGLATYQATGSFQIVSGYADDTSLHVLGTQGTDIVELAFPLGPNGDPLQPPQVTPTPNVCPNGFRGACFMRSGATLHSVATCNEGTDGGSTYGLYLDGALVATGPQDDLIVRGCAEVGSTLVVRTGPDLGSPVLRYGTTVSGLATPHPFALTTDPGRSTGLFSMFPPPPGAGLVLLGFTLAPPPQYTPLDIYAGLVPLAKFGDLDQVPVPELSKATTITNLNNVPSLSRPDVESSFAQYAGTTLDLGAVQLVVVGAGGKMLVFGQAVYTTNPTASQVIGAAIGSVGPSSIAVWVEQNPDHTNQRVRGQALLCAGG